MKHWVLTWFILTTLSIAWIILYVIIKFYQLNLKYMNPEEEIKDEVVEEAQEETTVKPIEETIEETESEEVVVEEVIEE